MVGVIVVTDRRQVTVVANTDVATDSLGVGEVDVTAYLQVVVYLALEGAANVHTLLVGIDNDTVVVHIAHRE